MFVRNFLYNIKRGIRHHINRTRGSAGTYSDEERRDCVCDNADAKPPCLLPCPYRGYKALSYWFPRPSFAPTTNTYGGHTESPEICNRQKKDSTVATSSIIEEETFFQNRQMTYPFPDNQLKMKLLAQLHLIRKKTGGRVARIISGRLLVMVRNR